MSSNKEELSEYMLENMDCVICKRTDIPRHKLHWNEYGSYTDTCEKCYKKQTKSKIKLVIVDDVIEEFKKYLGTKVIYNENNRYGYKCDFVIIPKCCPLKYGKYGWEECGKCMINYNCNHGGTKGFDEFLKTMDCRVGWIYPDLLGVWINKN